MGCDGQAGEVSLPPVPVDPDDVDGVHLRSGLGPGDLARDIVCILLEELHHLLAVGVALVQFDEPVHTEVVYSTRPRRRMFMCGALGERGSAGARRTWGSGGFEAVFPSLSRVGRKWFAP